MMPWTQAWLENHQKNHCNKCKKQLQKGGRGRKEVGTAIPKSRVVYTMYMDDNMQIQQASLHRAHTHTHTHTHTHHTIQPSLSCGAAEDMHVCVMYRDACCICYHPYTTLVGVHVGIAVPTAFCNEALKCETLGAVCQCNSLRHCTIWSLVQATAINE